jgi:hypothetical protein
MTFGLHFRIRVSENEDCIFDFISTAIASLCKIVLLPDIKHFNLRLGEEILYKSIQ